MLPPPAAVGSLERVRPSPEVGQCCLHLTPRLPSVGRCAGSADSSGLDSWWPQSPERPTGCPQPQASRSEPSCSLYR